MEVLGVSNATEVTAGGPHTCAVLSTGHIDCWGYNGDGQLGNGTISSSDTPVEVLGVSNATEVTAGHDHTCGLLSTGHIDCWGYNGDGQLGNGTASSSATPVEVLGVSNATEVTAGHDHTCGLLSTGHIDCWGYNFEGELGNGTEGGSDTPVEVQAISNALQVTAGGPHTCAVLSTGHIDCWGYNDDGELGDGTASSSDTPVEVLGVSNATEVTAGHDHTCALLSTGHIDCWGYNDDGQLGDGTISSSDTPVEVQGISNATQVTAGYFHTCAVLSSGRINCWGANSDGQLGNGRTRSSDTPVEVQGISNATQVAAGGYHTCAVLSSGHINCWGDNFRGTLGDGTISSSDTPVEVQGISNAIQVTADGSNTCALLSTGHINCWGDNGNGELGNGRTGKRGSYTPVEVQGISNATQVTAGENDTCALLSTGRINCWGENDDGKLGDGTTSSSDTPVVVQGVGNATQVAAGYFHACAALSSGHIDCWGNNENGDLGNGDSWSLVPTEVLLGAPVVLTGGASSVTGVSATLNATVNPEGGEVTSCEFDYGPTSAYGSSVPCSSLPGSGESLVDVSVSVSGLSAYSAYHFRIVSTNAAGTSHGEDATFTTESLPPDFGRCVKMPFDGGFTTSNCTVASPTHTGDYEWRVGAEKAGFTTTGGTVKLETSSKARVTCTTENAVGEITGFATVGAVVMTFGGCESEGANCTTGGQGEGVLQSKTLEGALGWQQKAAQEVALDIYPAGHTGPFMEYSCVGRPAVLTGSVLVPVTADKMMRTPKLKYKANEGKQKPEAFEGASADVLENSLEERVGLTFTATQTNEEPVEINTAF